MKFVAILPFVSLATALARDASHPIGSVITLLKDLQLKVESEGETELATWVKFQKWCSGSGDTLKDAVQSSKDDIDSLSDSVESLTKKVADVKDNIQFLEDEIVKYGNEETAAKKDRDAANTLYKSADADFKSTIKAVDEAITALKGSKSSAMLQFLKPINSRPRAFAAMLSRVLALFAAFISLTHALVLQGGAAAGALVRPATLASTRVGECPCMACRTNLKKEKRVRNRVNAFRFKKGGGPVRFNRFDNSKAEKGAEEDAQFYSVMFTATAEAAAAEAAKEAAQE